MPKSYLWFATYIYIYIYIYIDGLMSEIMPLAGLSSTSMSESEHTKFHQSSVMGIHGKSYYEHPHSVFVQPVLEELGNADADTYRNNLVGVIVSVVAWDRYLAHLLPSGVKGISAVLSNSCGQDHTYVVNGPMVSGASFIIAIADL